MHPCAYPPSPPSPPLPSLSLSPSLSVARAARPDRRRRGGGGGEHLCKVEEYQHDDHSLFVRNLLTRRLLALSAQPFSPFNRRENFRACNPSIHPPLPPPTPPEVGPAGRDHPGLSFVVVFLKSAVKAGRDRAAERSIR